MTRRQFYAELRSAAYFAVAALAVALVGRPQPLAIIVAGIGWLTAAIIAFRALNARGAPPPAPPAPPFAARTRPTLHNGHTEEDPNA